MYLQVCLYLNQYQRLLHSDHCDTLKTSMKKFFFKISSIRQNFIWNQLDTMIVVLSIAGIMMEKMKSGHILPINPTLIRVMRVLRIARGKSS
jgi:hypothetical protein